MYAYTAESEAAATIDTLTKRAGIACLKSGLCRFFTGAVGGAVATQLPKRLARVMPVNIFETTETLGAPNNADVFVTSVDDLANINSSTEIAKTLSLYNSSGSYVEGPFAVLEFDTVDGLASPILRNNMGFVGEGFTIGGAHEFVIPNISINSLQNLSVRIVQ